jgi:hypothetical protein
MKQLLLLPILLFLFVKANAQNRWMYLSTTTDSAVTMVDTLTNDIRQLSTYDGHSNVVLIWIKTTVGKSAKSSSLYDSSVSHIAIDTTNSQIAVKMTTTYKNGNVVTSANRDFPTWTDVVPETTGEVYIRYCQALHNKKLMVVLLTNALLQDPALYKTDK